MFFDVIEMFEMNRYVVGVIKCFVDEEILIICVFMVRNIF